MVGPNVFSCSDPIQIRYLRSTPPQSARGSTSITQSTGEAARGKGGRSGPLRLASELSIFEKEE